MSSHCRHAIHRQALAQSNFPSRPSPRHPSPSHPSRSSPSRQPSPSNSLLSPSCFYQRCIAVTASIPIALTSSCSLLSPHAVHRQDVHRRAVHHLAIHCRCRRAYIDVALPSRQPLLLRCSQATHCQAIAPSIAKLSLAEPFIAVAVKPSIPVASPRCHHVTDEPSIAVVLPSSCP